MTETIVKYRDYIQLHDNRTIWNCNKYNDDVYNQLVVEAISEFEASMGVKVYLEGRSGRHICVEDNPHNRQQFINMRRRALFLEKQVISAMNSAEIEEGDE
jgi:hypothetical protein